MLFQRISPLILTRQEAGHPRHDKSLATQQRSREESGALGNDWYGLVGVFTLRTSFVGLLKV